MNGTWGPKSLVEKDSQPSLGYKPFQSCLKNPMKKAAGRAPGKERYFPDKETVRAVAQVTRGVGDPPQRTSVPWGGSPWQQQLPPPPPPLVLGCQANNSVLSRPMPFPRPSASPRLWATPPALRDQRRKRAKSQILGGAPAAHITGPCDSAGQPQTSIVYLRSTSLRAGRGP